MIFDNDIFDLATAIRAVAEEHPERIAVIECKGRGRDGKRVYERFCYQQLSFDAESVAVGLREVGIREGTRTVFMAPPGYEACVLYVALTRVGAVVIMIDPSVGWRNVGERLRRLGPQAFVGIPLAHLARVIFGWGPRLFTHAIAVGGGGYVPGAHTIASLRRTPAEVPERANVGPDDPMTVLYTTGSTGPAKPALYTHRNFCGVFRIVHKSWGFDRSTQPPVDLAAFPAFFLVGLSAGGTVVTPPINFTRETPADNDPAAVLEVIQDCQVRSLFGSPVLLENLARHAVAHGITTPSLEVVIGGGAPITGPAMRALTQMMPNGEAFANYGATEALPSTAHSAHETLAETWAKTEAGQGICVGRPFAGVEIQVARIQDGAADDFEALPPGEIGELLVRSPHISVGYLDDPENTRKNKFGDWHRLGDAGYLDEVGRVWVVGRVSQRVRTPDGPLFPLLCEPIFNAHPGVKRSGLVGVFAGGAQEPVLCVEAQPGADLKVLHRELIAHARAHAVTRGITHILFIDRLPVDPRHNSKVERPKLAKWAARRLKRPRLAQSLGALVSVVMFMLVLHGCSDSAAVLGARPDDTGMADAAQLDAAQPDAGSRDASASERDTGGRDIHETDVNAPGKDASGAGDGDAAPPNPDVDASDTSEPDINEPAYDPIGWFTPGEMVPKTPHDQWNFIPVDGAVCANGQQSGFFINFSHTSSDVLIFLLGGGICYDDASCLMFINLVNDGLGPNPLNWWMHNPERTNGVFRRDNPENPFKDASYVVLPHCTVDFHSANKESTYPSTGTIQQRGYRNVQLAMNRVVPTFSNPERNVTIAGFSAGGVGTLANYHQIASAFEVYGHLPPFLINDSGPIQTRPFFSANSHNAIRRGWELQNTIEPWCETCAGQGYHETLYWIHQHHPGVRSSLINAYGDAVVMGLYGLFDLANATRFQVDIIPDPPFSYTHMKPGLDAFRTWSENFPTQGMHRNLLYHRGDRHGALTAAPIHEAHTPAIVPFLRAQMNRADPYWYSPHF